MEWEQDERPRVVIVGAGFGGLEVARGLRDAPVQVTVIDRANYHLFQPLLYQVATAGLSPAEISAPIRAVLRRQANAEVLLAEVTGVNVAGQAVLLGDRRVAYDYLVLATGARHSYFGHDEWEEYAPGLKSIADATRLRRNILLAFETAELTDDPAERAALLTFVIVGGGPTGVEMAGAIAELAHMALPQDFRRIDPAAARIILVEGMPHLVPSFPEGLSEKTRAHLGELGVEVHTGTMVRGIDAGGVQMGDTYIPARTVIWAAGVQASAAGAWLGASTDRAGRVLVGPDLSVPGHRNIFVIGDTAHVEEGGKMLPGVAQVALQQGRYVADRIRLRATRIETETPPFHYHNKGNMATVGRAFAIVETPRMQISGFPAWIMWLAVHIYFLIDFRNRLAVLLQWAWAYATYQRSARLIVEERDAERVAPPLGPLPSLR